MTPFPIGKKVSILALGSEYDTRLALYWNGEIIFSENVKDLVENEAKYEKFVLDFLGGHPSLKIRRARADVIITDLHPLYTSVKIGEKLSGLLNIPHIKCQHHVAHIFSAFGDYISQILNFKFKILNSYFYGIACDGTGYGLDGNIWGGEVFKIDNLIMPPRINAKKAPLSEQKKNFDLSDMALPACAGRRESTRKNSVLIRRIGHLEEQYLLGGEFAVEEPARMLISILSKFLRPEGIFKYVQKYYSKNEFNLLWNQLGQKFNCPLTTSSGRILDAVSLLLGFCENKRKYKHYPAKMLDKHTNMQRMRICLSAPATNYGARRAGKWQRVELMDGYLKPKIELNGTGQYILNTTELFEHLIAKRRKESMSFFQKKLLGYAAQRYVIEGLHEIVRMDYKKTADSSFGDTVKIFFSGGFAENKIMKKFAEENNIYTCRNIPSGDRGIALGQIMYYLFCQGTILNNTIISR